MFDRRPTDKLPAPVLYLISLMTLLVTLAVLDHFLKPEWTVLLLLSLGIHELAHWASFKWIGSRAVIYFAGPLGAVTVARDADAVRRASDWQEYVLSFSGPLVNLVFAAGGLMWQLSNPATQNGAIFAKMNLALFVWNLIPFGPVDGGKAFKAIFESLNEDGDTIISIVTKVVCLVAVFVTALHGYGWFVFIIIDLVVFRSSRRDDGHAHLLPTAMSHRRAMTLGLTTTLLLVGGAAILAANPFALTDILR